MPPGSLIRNMLKRHKKIKLYDQSVLMMARAAIIYAKKFISCHWSLFLHPKNIGKLQYFSGYRKRPVGRKGLMADVIFAT